ncbi:hypothetical protein MTR67_042694, partial [Solanum verrucosum]
KFFLTLFALTLILDQTNGQTNGIIHCGTDVTPKIIPCTSFMVGQVEIPPQICCDGMQILSRIAFDSELNHKVVCRCFKAALDSIPVDYSKARQLPQLCNFSSFVPIGPNLDCSKLSKHFFHPLIVVFRGESRIFQTWVHPEKCIKWELIRTWMHQEKYIK